MTSRGGRPSATLSLCCLLLTSVVACSSPSFTSTTGDSPAARGTTPVATYKDRGLSFGIRSEEGGPYWRTYRVAENSTFRGVFSLGNLQPAEDFLLTCVLDYRQVPCKFRGESRSSYRIRLRSNESADIAFETPPLAPGFHDFLVLAFARPRHPDLSLEYRIGTAQSNFLAAPRAILLSGDDPWRVPEPEYVTGEEERGGVFDGVFLGRGAEADRPRIWATQEVRPGEVVDYFAHLGNASDRARRFAVMAFMDGTQVPLDGARVWAEYREVKARTRTAVQHRFSSPLSSGMHEFALIAVEDPYRPLEEPLQGPNRELTRFSSIVQSSVRLAIVVRP